MTAARASMAQVIADTLGWDWPESHGVPSAVECTTDVADMILAAGFGDVAAAKADALEDAALATCKEAPRGARIEYVIKVTGITNGKEWVSWQHPFTEPQALQFLAAERARIGAAVESWQPSVLSAELLTRTVTDWAPRPMANEQARLEALPVIEELQRLVHDCDEPGSDAYQIIARADALVAEYRKAGESWPSDTPA